MRMAALMGGERRGSPEEAVLSALRRADRSAVERLARASEIPALADEAPCAASARGLLDSLSAPVEHLRDPAELYQSATDVGLKAMIKIDNWVRVMEPEKVTPRAGANILYDPPPAEELSDMQKLFKVFATFLSIEERELQLEDELAEYGYRLEELHDALNGIERVLKFDPNPVWLPRDEANLLSVVAADLLGKGFGQELKVERFADSIGLDRAALHRTMVTFGAFSGYDLCWLIGREAEAAVSEDDPETACSLAP